MTLSTSDINRRKLWKPVYVHAIVAAALVIANLVYSLFSHGIRSAAMVWMFLSPLLGGSLFFLLVKGLFPGINGVRGYRLFFNLHNSGIASLVASAFLRGVLEIAGTASPYPPWIGAVGWMFIGAGLIVFARVIIRYKRQGMAS